MIKTYTQYLNESRVHDLALGLGLQYYGFGRYGVNGKVTHHNQAGRLVRVTPYSKDSGEKFLPHYEHLEDQIFNSGVRGAGDAMDILHSLINQEHDHEQKIHLQTKIDGAPSIVAGWHGDKFFVATKSIANKNPKINYTHEDVETNHGHSPGLSSKLHLALEHLRKIIPPNSIIQGDMMFDKNDVDVRQINNQRHYTFKPNVVRNAIPVSSEMGRRIERSKIGFAPHTMFDGETKKPANEGNVLSHPDVFVMPITTPNTQRTYELGKKMHELGSLMSRTPGTALNYVSQDSMRDLIKQYINSEVRKGNTNLLTGDGFVEWLTNKRLSEIGKIKNEATAEKKRQEYAISLNNIRSHTADINSAFRLHMAIASLKHDVINALNDKQQVKRFFDTTDSIEPTGPEGYVAITHSGTHKLVNRNEFSRQNFNQPKDWDKPKHAVLTFGRMSPPHKDHGNLISAVHTHAKSVGGDPYVYVSHTFDHNKNPLTSKEKLAILRKMHPEYKGSFHSSSERSPSLLYVLNDLYKNGYSEATVVLGDDRVDEMKKTLEKYNGVMNEKGEGYKFKKINVISRHQINNTRDGDSDGVHASDIRKAALANDKDFMKTAMPNLSQGMRDAVMKRLQGRIKVKAKK